MLLGGKLDGARKSKSSPLHQPAHSAASKNARPDPRPFGGIANPPYPSLPPDQYSRYSRGHSQAPPVIKAIMAACMDARMAAPNLASIRLIRSRMPRNRARLRVVEVFAGLAWSSDSASRSS
jgi:hypothetical protein